MSNVDPGEIERFGKLAAGWWDPNGDTGPLHAINPPRTHYIERCAGGLRNKRALDVGCGGGLLSESLAARGAQVTGIDLAPDVIEIAQAHAAQGKLTIDYRRVAVEELAAEQPASFDLVCCLEMLEHVPQPDAIVAACAALTRPGGTLVFSTINRHPKAFALAIVGAEYLTRLVPRGTHDYAKFIRPSELDAWARAAGLEVVGVKGIRYNPLLRSASLVGAVDVNYLLHARKPG